MQVFNLDTWDSFEGGKLHLSLPNDPFSQVSNFQFETMLFIGTAVDPVAGAILLPSITTKFFSRTRSQHIIYTHMSSNVTSIKKVIRAVMPSDFVTEPHWVVLSGNRVSQGISLPFNWSSVVSNSIELTFQQIVGLCSPEEQSYGEEIYIELRTLSVVLRRLL